jgi:hypothetical protein
MWIAKGTLLGLWLLGFGTIAIFYFAVFRHLPPNSIVPATILARYTIQSPFWWAVLVACFILGYTIARPWSGPTILWVGLLVTGLIPAGFLALFIFLVYKLNQVNRGLGP